MFSLALAFQTCKGTTTIPPLAAISPLVNLRGILSLIDVDIESFFAQEAVRVCSCMGASEQTIRVMQEWTLIPRMLSGNNDAGYEH